MKVSIVTITHNRAHLIAETIHSVLNQTHVDFEHIIIDDGSTDDTEKVVNQIKDSRIKYYKYKKHPLRSFLRNEGMRKASGELVSILDSDDLWMKDKLEIVASVFNNDPSIDFVIHNLSFIISGQTTERVMRGNTGHMNHMLSDLLNDKMQPYPIFTIRKKALEKFGLLDEGMIDGQQDFYLRAASELKIYYIDNVLTHMRKHNQNISSKANVRHYDDYFKTLNKLKSIGLISNEMQKSVACRIYYYKGQYYRSNNDKSMAISNFKKSFQYKLFCQMGLKSLFNYLRLML